MRHRSLRSFRPRTTYVSDWTSGAPGPFCIVPGTKILALEDYNVPIRIGNEPEALRASMIMSAISWPSLRRLDVQYESIASPLIKELTGRVPQLKCISFRLLYGYGQEQYDLQYNTWVAFFKSIDSLEEISVINNDHNRGADDPLWFAILRLHGKMLRKVNVKGWITDGIVDVIVRKGSALENLSLPILDRWGKENEWPYIMMENLVSESLR